MTSQLGLFTPPTKAPAPRPARAPRNYGEAFGGHRAALLELLSDCQWHSHVALGRVASNRYGARVLELKRLGYRIDSCELDSGKRYRLASTTPAAPQPKRGRMYLGEPDLASIVDGTPSPAARAEAARALKSTRRREDQL